MTDNDVRKYGVYGVRRGEAPTAVAARVPNDTEHPPGFNVTHGLHRTNMFGNDRWANCFWAMVANAMIFQAMTGLDEHKNPVFVAGFTPPTPEDPVDWYEVYAQAQGTPFTSPPGGGTGIYSGAQSILDQGLARYVGVLGPDEDVNGNWVFDENVIRQAIFDFAGGAGFCLALDPDAMKEFATHVPWGTDSTKPDAQDGHAVCGPGYEPPTSKDGVLFWTWSQAQRSTDTFDTNCIDGLVLLITEGFVTKIGENAALALADKWGLTAATPLAA